tara:strand:- start:81 stop:374 length:294 start_codon:yes stop_codon:yes gene_type:complete
MSKSRKRKKNNKKKIKPISKEMIPQVEKDLEEVFSLIDEIGKVDFWAEDSDKFANNLIKKSQKLESKIKNKYKGHFDENEVKEKLPKEWKNHLDSEE